jgi:acyl-CoA synthetase (AMP-forming)/AMP-acid ligase II
VVTLLREAADRVPDQPALVERGPGGGDRVIPFGRLWEAVDRTSGGLTDAGLSAGDRVVVMIPMSIDLYTALLAVLKMGAVAVFVDPWLGRRQIAAFAAFATPRGYVGTPASHVLRWLDRRLFEIPLTVTAGHRWWRLPARFTLAELRGRAGTGAIQPVAADDTALITFTSGSSGDPKGANRTHRFLAAQHRAQAREFPYRDDDVDMTMFPVFALNNLARGITSIVPEIDFRRVAQMDAAAVAGQMLSHGVTTSTASPVFFDRLAAICARSSENRPALRRILTGGAPVTNSQLKIWRNVWPDTEIVVVYGSTEAEPVSHITAQERLSIHSDTRRTTPGYCVGHAVSAVQTRLIRITDEAVNVERGGWSQWQVAPGEVGELVVAGEHVCRDYYQNPEATAQTKIDDRDGTVWHRMGDTGYFDSQYRFWLVGRVHSTIRRAGDFVHPQLVEQAARAADKRIRQVAAVGLPDRSLGERVAVVVVHAPGESDDAIRQVVSSRLAGSEMPCDEVIVTHRPLPVDPRHNQKIDYDGVREWLVRR